MTVGFASRYVSLVNAGEGAIVVIYEMRDTPQSRAAGTWPWAVRSAGTKDTVFAMRVTVDTT